MAVLRCKMCGAHLNILTKLESIECEYCGTVYMLPKTEVQKQFVEIEEDVVDEELERKQRIYDADELAERCIKLEAEARKREQEEEEAFKKEQAAFSGLRENVREDEMEDWIRNNQEERQKPGKIMIGLIYIVAMIIYGVFLTMK